MPSSDRTSWRLIAAALSVVLVGVAVVVIGVVATPSTSTPTPTPALASALAFQENATPTPTPRVIAIPGTTETPMPVAASTVTPVPTATTLPTAPSTQEGAPLANATPTPWLSIEDATSVAGTTTIAATTSTAAMAPASVPSTTVAAVIVPSATVLSVAAMPSPTPVPPPTPTVAPPAATVLPTIGPVPTIGPSSTTRLTFAAADWAGGYYRGDGQVYGRPWVAIYGAYSAYPRATLSFTLIEPPTQDVSVTITGLDDEWADLNQIALDVNGQIVFTGASPFANWDGAGNGASAVWTSVPFTIPTGALRSGTNEIALANLTPANSFNSPPYVLVSDVTLDLPAVAGATIVPSSEVPANVSTGGAGSDKHKAPKKQKDEHSNGHGEKKGHEKGKHGH